MFVASRVESGDEGEAVVALLPQVIGHIQTAIGCGTLRRASGIVVQVMVGDPVCQGDVIETAADGRIGIRFIDGTVFNLSRGTRVVLDEFVCDSNGTSHSALFAVTRGAFAFIAGQVAKTGSLRVDTPVGSIRGRAHAGGIGMLSLAALTFSIMKEVQAADANVTFLDDDSITYKDLAHGAFELVTKEAIPRHIIVEDPGETIVLNRIGSSISVNQVANTATRMEELQAAQQDVLANFAKGLGTTGSSTPPFVNPLPVQPINFIQTDAPPAQNSLPPLPSIPVIPEIIILHAPPPPPPPASPPTLTVATGPTEIDTVAFDTFTATSGTFAASSPNSGVTLTFGISGGTAGSTVLGGATYDVSQTGPYGTLFVNSTTGAYTFVPDSGAINALTTPTTASFTVTVSDGALSANQAFTIAINGTNDAAIISGITTGSAIEAGGAANATPGPPTATGTLTDTDVDNTPNTFTPVGSPKASAGGYGTFTMTAAGVWTYALNDANSAVQALNVGDTLTDTFTVTTVDGTAEVVTITIHGTNDAAIISGTTTGSVIEASCARPGTPIATGTLTDTDVDNTPNTFTPVSSPKASAGGYGTFTMTAAGVWTYTLDNANCAVQALNACDTLTDTFTVTTVDGTAQVVKITIHGTNDSNHNHFDSLAAGSKEISDSPHVDGTPRDTIAGGGDDGQIVYGRTGDGTINGTGRSDLIHGAAGNDTLKGNDGDHTIYGGSGSDTINGNIGSDTIVGGHGADDRTSSNGHGRFVHLSVADSNAPLFDTISDFISGSDRIDLTALGAPAFIILALTSTSTSVPAHTIAWFYDGTANQTVVYVNPTDQTLSIGNTGLVEIHLQGVLAVEASDFVFAPTTAPTGVAGEPIKLGLAAAAQNDGAVVTMTIADVPSDRTVNDGVLLADGNRTVQTTDVGHSFDAARDQIDLIGYARCTSFGEVRTHTTEDTHDSAVITLANRQSIVLQRDHVTAPTENNVTFDQKLVLDSASATTIGDGAVMPLSGTIHNPNITALNTASDRTELPLVEHGITPVSSIVTLNNEDHRALILKNAGSTNAADNHVHTIDTGPNVVLNSGVLKASENGGGGNHSISGEVSEHGTALMHGAGALDFEPSSIARVVFGSGAAGTLGLGDSFHFKDEISGFEGSGVIDLADVDHTPASISHRENAAGTHGPEGAQTIELSLPGQHSADHFNIVPDHAGGAVVTHVPHDLIV